MLIEVLIATAFAIFAGCVLWSFVREFFRSSIVPALRERVSEAVGDLVEYLIGAIDEPASAVRSRAKRAWRSFCHHVVGVRAHVRKIDDERYAVDEEITLKEEGGPSTRCRRRVIPRSELPAEFLERVEQSGRGAAEIDLKEEFEAQVREKLPMAMTG